MVQRIQQIVNNFINVSQNKGLQKIIQMGEIFIPRINVKIKINKKLLQINLSTEYGHHKMKLLHWLC